MAVPVPKFVDMFNTPGRPAEISGGKQMHRIEFSSANYNCKYAWIKDATFSDWVVFEKVNLGVGIKFQNCRFLKGVSFSNCSAEGRELEFNSDSNSVYFIDCEVELFQLPVINTFERGVLISGGGIGTLLVSHLQVSKGGFRIESTILSKHFTISNSILEDKSGQLTISKSTVGASIRYENIFAGGGIVFLQSKFEKEVFVWGGEVGSIIFNDGSFLDDVSIHAIQNEGELSIIGAAFEKSVIVTFDDPSTRFELDDDATQNNEAEDEKLISGFHRKIFIANNKLGRFLSINGNNEVVEELTIACNKSAEGTHQFNDCQIAEVNISGDNKSSNYRFYFCDLEKVNLSNLTNSGIISFSSCKAIKSDDSLFDSSSSNLGKLELFNFLFGSYKKVRFADSLIAEIITTGVEWFDDRNLEVADNGRQHRNRREVYRQLKQVCDRQGDRIQALEFQALELVSFRNEVTQNKKWFNKDSLILTFSSTNDFGLNWLKPLFWILSLTTIIFYPLIVISYSDHLKFAPASTMYDLRTTFHILVKNINILPQLFNPTRLTFRLFPDETHIGFWVHLWDGLQRIVLAFFIVQIVSAFRKYVKN